MAVTFGSASDADRGNLKFFCEEGSQWRVNEFQNNGTHTGLFEGMGITVETVAFSGGFSLDVVAAFFDHALREHAKMADHRNAVSEYRLNHWKTLESAFDFNSSGTRFPKKSGVFDCECRGHAAAGGKVACEQGFFCPTGDGAGVVEHVSHGHLGGIRIAEYDHAQRITDKDEVQPTVIEKPGGRIIVGGEAGEAATGRFGFT